MPASSAHKQGHGQVFETSLARSFIDAKDQIGERARRACQLFPCHLLVWQRTVNNHLNALRVSLGSFFVNVTHFISKSKPTDLGFQKLECFC